MRRLFFLVVLLAAPVAQAQTLSDFGWLVGCWRTDAPAEGGAQFTEVWTAPPMPALLGYGYTIRAGEVRAWEQTRIEMRDGRATFVAMPNGGAPVAFTLRAEDVLVPNVAQFDNSAHDYPQTVEYRRVGDDLIATTSGANGADAFSFHYHAIACDAALTP